MYLDADSILDFGKHVGLSLDEIAEVDPTYIIWMNDNLGGFDINQEFVDSVRMDIEEEEAESFDV